MGLARPVNDLVKMIPASTRSDLANRFLDLYQRFAVLWARNFCSSGLPVVSLLLFKKKRLHLFGTSFFSYMPHPSFRLRSLCPGISPTARTFTAPYLRLT